MIFAFIGEFVLKTLKKMKNRLQMYVFGMYIAIPENGEILSP